MTEAAVPGARRGGASVPSVGVVIVTRGRRPRLLRAAVRAVLTQEHPGDLELVIVVDHDPRDTPGDAVARVTAQLAPVLASPPGRPRPRILSNRRTPGLPGARNTGIAALGTDLVAFCDDDDEWLPGKLRAQVAALTARPGALFASCAIEVEYGARRSVRLAGTDTITAAALRRSRMVMVHSSTFLFRRSAFRVDESAPGGQNEDWDLALRAAAVRPIVHVDRPLVRVRWGGSDYATRWADRIAGLEWMLARHAELGNRAHACRWAWRAAATRPGEPRAPLALAVAAGLISAHRVVNLLHARGHGV